MLYSELTTRFGSVGYTPTHNIYYIGIERAYIMFLYIVDTYIYI